MSTNHSTFQPTSFGNRTNEQLKFQLSYCEFMTLYALLADATSRQTPRHDLYKKLLHNIMVGTFRKFFSESSELKNVYIIELSSIECLAFWLYWTDHPYSESTLTGKTLERINNIIRVLFTT